MRQNCVRPSSFVLRSLSVPGPLFVVRGRRPTSRFLSPTVNRRCSRAHQGPGTEAYDTIRLRRVDERTAEVVLSHAGRVYGRARRVVSEDGRTLTIAFRQGDRETFTNNVAIYRKD
jgi:hypothetical protein